MPRGHGHIPDATATDRTGERDSLIIEAQINVDDISDVHPDMRADVHRLQGTTEFNRRYQRPQERLRPAQRPESARGVFGQPALLKSTLPAYAYSFAPAPAPTIGLTLGVIGSGL